jgi:hypothetical protein
MAQRGLIPKSRENRMSRKPPLHCAILAVAVVGALLTAPQSALSDGTRKNAPVGGPGGYVSAPLLDDSFGSAKPGANITSVSQFNPSTPYGANGTGWDRFMKGWSNQGPCNCANIVMQPDDLDISPGIQGPAFIVSHFEFLPTGSERYYVEVRAVTGRGGYNGQTWPAIWFFSGNGPTRNNQRSELDGMEIWNDLSFGTRADSDGLYSHYYTITSLDAGRQYEKQTITTGNDITVNYNVYGFELYRDALGNIVMDGYFNGAKKASLARGLPWRSSPPAIVIGYNPGATSYRPAVMKLDYVKVWKK